uniref:Uncharacterized protein n=1 Tax=Caenorhabditis tropicalis TaxID=1561998 RepID=A0A1I7T981_9PELO
MDKNESATKEKKKKKTMKEYFGTTQDRFTARNRIKRLQLFFFPSFLPFSFLLFRFLQPQAVVAKTFHSVTKFNVPSVRSSEKFY